MATKETKTHFNYSHKCNTAHKQKCSPIVSAQTTNQIYEISSGIFVLFGLYEVFVGIVFLPHSGWFSAASSFLTKPFQESIFNVEIATNGPTYGWFLLKHPHFLTHTNTYSSQQKYSDLFHFVHLKRYKRLFINIVTIRHFCICRFGFCCHHQRNGEHFRQSGRCWYVTFVLCHFSKHWKHPEVPKYSRCNEQWHFYLYEQKWVCEFI